MNSSLAQAAKGMIALGVYVTHAIACYVGIDIAWTQYLYKRVEKSSYKTLWEYVLRTGVVLLTCKCFSHYFPCTSHFLSTRFSCMYVLSYFTLRKQMAIKRVESIKTNESKTIFWWNSFWVVNCDVRIFVFFSNYLIHSYIHKNLNNNWRIKKSHDYYYKKIKFKELKMFGHIKW